MNSIIGNLFRDAHGTFGFFWYSPESPIECEAWGFCSLLDAARAMQQSIEGVLTL